MMLRFFASSGKARPFHKIRQSAWPMSFFVPPSGSNGSMRYTKNIYSVSHLYALLQLLQAQVTVEAHASVPSVFPWFLHFNCSYT
jgi:hypothetical protein